jgi:hypothetical protein
MREEREQIVVERVEGVEGKERSCAWKSGVKADFRYAESPTTNC